MSLARGDTVRIKHGAKFQFDKPPMLFFDLSCAYYILSSFGNWLQIKPCQGDKCLITIRDADVEKFYNQGGEEITKEKKDNICQERFCFIINT
jgi:hypothetical protein